MDDLLNYGVEVLGNMLKGNSSTKMAFKSITDAMEEMSKLINEENRGIVLSLIREC